MLRRLRFIAALPLLIALLLAACGSDEDATSTPAGGGNADPTGTAADPSPTAEPDATPSPGTTDLGGTSWVVVELDGEPPLTGSEITLSFDDSEISGSGGCNTYGADYVAGDESLSIEALMITEMGCSEPEGVLEQEQAYVDALVQAASYRLEAGSNRLEILDESGEVRIIFTFTDQGEPSGTEGPAGTESPKGGDEPVGTGALDGTDWVLTHINGEEVAPDTPATLIFWANQYMGEFGCLEYSGQLATTARSDVQEMSISPRERNCERSAAPDLSETYMAALKKVRQYRQTGDRLDLLDEIGKIVLTYRPAVTDQSGLDDTSWTLVDLDGAQVLPDTEITLSFSNGGVGGNAGCNGYGSPYIVPVEGVISMPQVVSTAMGCPEPPGLKEQETAYLQALYGVTGYRLSGNRLELMNEAGEVVLVYQVAIEDLGSLDGSSWTLVTIHGAPPVEGTTITLFIRDSWFEGNGGCNEYVGEYTTDDESSFSIRGQVGSSDDGCIYSPGVRDQEHAYFDALGLAATYRITDISLELFSEAGETILVFERWTSDD